MGSANERWCYNVTLSVIGWANTQNDPCLELFMRLFARDNFNIYIYDFAFNWIFWFDEISKFWAIPIQRRQGLRSDFILINLLKIYWMDNAEYSYEYEKKSILKERTLSMWYWLYSQEMCIQHGLFSPKNPLKTLHISVHVGQVTKLRLSCYLVLLSVDSKTG